MKDATAIEAALDVLFDKMEEACKQAGLDLKIEFEDDEPGVWTMAMCIEGGLLEIYGGEITITDDNYEELLKWARIEGATSIAELPEGIAAADPVIREKAERKRRELVETLVKTHMG